MSVYIITVKHMFLEH